MGESPADQLDAKPTSGQYLPILLLLFVGSGCSALIYEIVWFQLLQLVIGSSAVSLGVLLGTFMGGMCIGSIVLPRLIASDRHPLRVYAFLELGIGIIGIVLLFGMPLIANLYTSNVGYGMSSILFRGALCALCLLPPTILMGATLPAIARWMETTPRGVSQLGYFYGANIAGAVFGCLLAGFYLLRVYDTAIATYVAVFFNVLVAGISLVLAGQSGVFTPSQSSTEAVEPAPHAWAVYLTIGLSGMTALGAEVIWTRQLSLLLGASIYTFSIILAVFLTGLGIGSSLGAYFAREVIHPRLLLGWCQLLIAGGIAWSAYQLGVSLPYWPIDLALVQSPWLSFQLDLMRCVWALLPATILWGASFPLALASVATRGQDPGRLVGGVYAANTVGAIVGALCGSMVMIPWLGSQNTQRFWIGMAGVSALLMFATHAWTTATSRSRESTASPATQFAFALLLLVNVLGAGAALWSVPETPRGLIAYGRHLPMTEYDNRNVDPEDREKFLYFGEGMNASIAVSEYPDGSRQFHVSGKVVASSLPFDMRLQRMLGHLPALIHPEPESVLIVGCGAGVTAGSFIPYPSIKKIVICEIEPLIPPAARDYFGEFNHKVLEDPRVEVIEDDARHYIITTDQKFDIITSDPIHPWVKGAAALYSKEYFELCKQRLNPGGVVTQWVPLYESNLEAVKSEIATFFAVFPEGTIWRNNKWDSESQTEYGYDIVLLGQTGPTNIDVDALQVRLGTEEYNGVVDSLLEAEFFSTAQLLGTYAGHSSDLKKWMSDGEINTDRNLRLQYLAGMGLNTQNADTIFQSFFRLCRYPKDLFVTTKEQEAELRELMKLSR